MIFHGTENQSISLFIAGYQFPENSTPKDFDANWLNIHLEVDCKQGHWKRSDPALLSWEVEELIAWLNAILQERDNVLDVLIFTEPSLNFQFKGKKGEHFLFRIELDLEFRNPNLEKDVPCFVDFRFSKTEVLALCLDLEEELQYYPAR